MKVEVNGKVFKSKKTLQNHCRYILSNAKLNAALSGYEHEMMDAVFRMHSDYEDKIKGQKYTIGVRRCNVNPRHRQFFILREDGTDTEFSFYKAIDGAAAKKDPNVESEFKRSLRYSIKDQVVEYKENYFAQNADRLGRVVCPQSGVKVYKKDCHIDHYPVQFNDIVTDWFSKEGLNIDEITMHSSEDNATHWTIEDTSIVESFQEYHKAHAKYRIVLDKVNLQRERPKRRKLK